MNSDGCQGTHLRSEFSGLLIVVQVVMLVGIANAGVVSAQVPNEGSNGESGPVKSTAKVPNPAGVLEEYVREPDNSFAWELKGRGESGGVNYAEIILTSQTWRDYIWKHQMFVLIPEGVEPDEESALFVIAGGRWSDDLLESPLEGLNRRTAIYFSIAKQLQSPLVILLQVPHQPMFEGRVEDEIIALTFEEYINTQDAKWPVLLPMVKSVVRGMDAAQDFLKDEHSLDIERFTVTGASKRGWTTWLTGAVDDRAAAIAPMVIDVLNMSPQMKFQKKVWGQYSDEIGDYTERGLQDLLESRKGQTLREIVDPYSYRQEIEQPKLIFIGTNDAYWPIDALHLYWGGLIGEKHISYVPNTGHDLADMKRVVGNLNAIHMQTQGRSQMPKFRWQFEATDDGLNLTIDPGEQPDGVTIWYAESDKRDFRESEWKPASPAAEGDRYRYLQQRSNDKYVAFFGELRFQRGSLPTYLSTNVRVVEPSGGQDQNR